MLPIALVLAAMAASTADARPRPARSARKRFESNKGFGAGLELGAPFAITGKYWLGEGSDRALDFGVGYLDYYYDWRGLYLYVDYLFHPVSLASTESFELPFYIGVGAQFWSWTDYNYVGGQCTPQFPCGGDGIGVRVPIGLAFDFNNVPMDIFLQIVPNFDVFFSTPPGYSRGVFEPFLLASVGVRYYFN
jgi:hypothetical protein